LLDRIARHVHILEMNGDKIVLPQAQAQPRNTGSTASFVGPRERRAFVSMPLLLLGFV
jgi:hypothetical protein